VAEFPAVRPVGLRQRGEEAAQIGRPLDGLKGVQVGRLAILDDRSRRGEIIRGEGDRRVE